MPQILPNKKYLYFLADKDGRTYSVVNGAVQVSQKKPLDNAPIGWDEIQTSFTTSKQYFSLTRTFAVPLQFVRDGAQILRHFMYNVSGANTELYVIIMRQDRNRLMYYKGEYKGKINFEKFEDDPDLGVTVDVAEGGPQMYINAKDDQTLEKDLIASTTTINVLFDGLDFFDTLNYQVTEASTFDQMPNDEAYGQFSCVPIVYLNNNGDSVGIVPGNSYPDPMGFSYGDVFAYANRNSNYLYLSVNPITIDLKLKLDYDLQALPEGGLISFYFFTNVQDGIEPSTGNPQPRFIPILPEQIKPVGDNAQLFSGTIALAANERLFIGCSVKRTPDDIALILPVINFKNTGFLTIAFTSRQPASVVVCERPLTVWQWLISTLTEGRYVGASNLLTASSNLVLTGGEALRQLKGTDGNPKALLKTSLKDFFNAFDVLKDVALKVVGNVVYLEKKTELYNVNNGLIFDLGEVLKCKIFAAEEYFAGQFIVGLPKQTYSKRNGRYETNARVEYTLPGNSSKVYSADTVYRWDPYGMEFIRALAGDDETTDAKSDNEVFVVNISNEQDANGNYLLNRKTYDVSPPVGIPTASVYNIEEMTPKRILLAHAASLRLRLYQAAMFAKIKVSTADKNKDLVTVLNNVVTSEAADVPVTSLGTPLALPYIAEIQVKTPVTFAEMLEALAGGLIKFTFKNRPVNCLPIGEMVSKGVDNAEQTWKLLIAPNNSLAGLAILSKEGIFALDYTNNMILAADLNSVHWLPFDEVAEPKYHHKDLYGDYFKNRYTRFVSSPNYHQKWQVTDPIANQFITAQIGNLEIHVYNNLGEVVLTVPMDVLTASEVELPYVLNQNSFSAGLLPNGCYSFALVSSGQIVFVSEFQMVETDLPETYLIEYFNSYNTQNTFFNTTDTDGLPRNFRPAIRVEAMFQTPDFKMSSVDYTNSNESKQKAKADPYKIEVLTMGNGVGIPDYLANKLNAVTSLDSTSVEGKRYTRPEDSGDMESEKRLGAPMDIYKIKLQRTFNIYGVSVNDINVPEGNRTAVYMLDNEIFGQAPGVESAEIIE